MQYNPLRPNWPGLIIPIKLEDERGYFLESYKERWFRETVADVGFVQDNQSMSVDAGTIRGLHYQSAPFGQGKLIRCLRGAVFDVVVDIRIESETFGQWAGVELTEKGGEQLWIPEGFAHGFCTIEPDTVVSYKVTNYYSREHEGGLAFDDADVGIRWPINAAKAILSEKDKAQPRLKDLKR